MTDYSQMSDQQINRYVGLAVGVKPRKTICFIAYKESEEIWPDYCNNPADAWPIIMGNGISLVKFGHGMWCADAGAYWVDGVEWQIDGECHPNPLRAAMITFLAMNGAKNA